MPIYAYKCDACGHRQDVLQKMSDALLTVCPSCGAAAFSKQLTAAGFQLKGSGWYATDFKNGGAKPEVKDGTKAEGGDAPAKDGAKAAESGAEAKGGDGKTAAAPAPAAAPAEAAKSAKPATPAAAPAVPPAKGA